MQINILSRTKNAIMPINFLSRTKIVGPDLSWPAPIDRQNATTPRMRSIL